MHFWQYYNYRHLMTLFLILVVKENIQSSRNVSDYIKTEKM